MKTIIGKILRRAPLRCPACDRPLPPAADACPYCGEDIPAGKFRLAARLALFASLPCVLIGLWQTRPLPLPVLPVSLVAACALGLAVVVLFTPFQWRACPPSARRTRTVILLRHLGQRFGFASLIAIASRTLRSVPLDLTPATLLLLVGALLAAAAALLISDDTRHGLAAGLLAGFSI